MPRLEVELVVPIPEKDRGSQSSISRLMQENAFAGFQERKHSGIHSRWSCGASALRRIR